MWRGFLLALIVAVTLNAACPCVIQFGVCDEARQSDAVFVGTVESVAPSFLDPFARAKAMASLPAAEAARLREDASPEALAQLKKIYLDMFAGLPDNIRAQIAEAKTQPQLQRAFEELQSEGRVARFRVRTMYKHEGEDDKSDDKNDDEDDKAPEFLDIWTGGGECGIDFQVGESYLVYAVQDEDSGKLETSVCMRTRRLSDERGDMGFLFFLQNAEKESTRVEGFVSTSLEDQSVPRYVDSIGSPAPGTVLELDTGNGFRYAQSDHDGRFSFDGLREGDYRLSLLAPGFPRTPRTVLTTRRFHAGAAACVRQILILPATAP